MTDASPNAAIFVSYARADVDFVDQLTIALVDKNFEVLIDRQAIHAAENWQERILELLTHSDTVIFVLTKASMSSRTCQWELEEALRLRKRIVPVVPTQLRNVRAHHALKELNYVHFCKQPGIPSSGFYDGLLKLTHALMIDLDWLRREARLMAQALDWRANKSGDHLLRGMALQEAVLWRTGMPVRQSISPLIEDFLHASQSNESERLEEARKQVDAMEAQQKRISQQVEELRQQREQLKAANEQLVKVSEVFSTLIDQIRLVRTSVAGATAEEHSQPDMKELFAQLTTVIRDFRKEMRR